MERDEELERILQRKLERMLRKTEGSNALRMESARKGVIELNSKDFDKFVANANAPVLVDFWAVWCAPCLAMAPIIEELARDYAGRVLFAKVNVDENPDVASRFGIMAIPTFILFKGGKPVDRMIGAAGREPLERMIKKWV